MSAAAQPPAPTPDPDPPRAAKPMPAALGRVLGVLRKLIDYGKHLAATVQQRAATPGFALLARPFGTADIADHPRPHHQRPAPRRRPGSRPAQARRPRPGPHAIALPPPPERRAPPARSAPPDPQPANTTEDPRLARLPTEAGNRRRGPPPSDRRRHRRHLPRPRHHARPVRPRILGRTQPRHRRQRRQPRKLLHKHEQTPVRFRRRHPLRPSGPPIPRTTATTPGTRHRPTLKSTLHPHRQPAFAPIIMAGPGPRLSASPLMAKPGPRRRAIPDAGPSPHVRYDKRGSTMILPLPLREGVGGRGDLQWPIFGLHPSPQPPPARESGTLPPASAAI